ncbi:beta-galactosidase [Micrococcales bacterium 31B]|nr:beta-galactosidase [Micrococcales bacterium 31B]
MPTLPSLPPLRPLRDTLQRAKKAATAVDARLGLSRGLPRPEHPRPQFVRDTWKSLNGTWQFEIDQSDTGLERGLLQRPLRRGITVPFAPESTLSGVGHTGFMEAVWYRRDVKVPPEWRGRRVLLHFGAVDFEATVWVNGVEVARHRGGFAPFSADITEHAVPGRSATLVVRARDPKNGPQARGKQATWEPNTHCHYTRTTGIWRTVWLESVPLRAHLRRVAFTPQVAAGAVQAVAELSQNVTGARLEYQVRFAGVEVARAIIAADVDLAPSVTLQLAPEDVHLWGPGEPHLYDVTVTLTWPGGAGEQRVESDVVETYTALRSVALEGTQVRLNGRPVFQRLVLDQGYYPDGIMTAPTDEALELDIQLALAAGFNGARLHQKVFEERYLYHADRHGFLVWGEYADWGVSGAGRQGENQRPQLHFVTEWIAVLRRDFNHPSIIGWCPLNETHQRLTDQVTDLDDATHALYEATKLADPTRPVIDASGYSHRVPHTDIYDAHTYEQNPRRLAREVGGLASGRAFTNTGADGVTWSLPYRGQPYWISEFGGIWWNAEAAARSKRGGNESGESWGYGARVRSAEEFYERFAGLVGVLLDDPHMFGYCYTQLTDVFQEQNGVYGFDRTAKFDVTRLAAAQTRPAACEGAD